MPMHEDELYQLVECFMSEINKKIVAMLQLFGVKNIKYFKVCWIKSI